MKRELERDFISVQHSEGKKLKLWRDDGMESNDQVVDHAPVMHSNVDEISSDDFILPIEIKLYILEFIQFPLSRYATVSEADFLKEFKKVMDMKNINLERAWKIIRRIAHKRMIKFMFGYFTGKVTNLEKDRQVYLLYKHVNYEYVGLWGQDEYYSNLRFRDLKSIQFSKDYSFAAKFAYWNYMPNLESIQGLNLEHEGMEENFMNNVNRTKLTCLTFGDAKKGGVVRDGKKFFQTLPNITSLTISPDYGPDILVLKKLKHLKLTHGTIPFEVLHAILNNMENLETLDFGKVTVLPSPDRSIGTPSSKLKLRRLYATNHEFTPKLFSDMIKKVYFFPHLTDLRIGTKPGAQPSSWEEFANYCKEFSQLEHISLKGTEFNGEHLGILRHLTNLKSIRDINVSDCSKLSNLTSLKLLTIDPKCSHSVDYSGLNHIEELSTVVSYSLIRNLKESNFLTGLKKLSLQVQNETTINYMANELYTLGIYKPHLCIHLSIIPTISEDTFNKLLSCPLIESLTVKCNIIPESIQHNTTLKNLTLHVNSIFVLPDYLASNKTIEEIRIYGMDPNLIMTSHQEIYDFMGKSKASYISFVDPERVGFLDKGEHDPDVMLW